MIARPWSVVGPYKQAAYDRLKELGLPIPRDLQQEIDCWGKK